MTYKETATMTYVDIALVDPNPYRDFNIYPVNPEQVNKLAASYNHEDGGRDFGIIAVRPVGDRYQQVFGHHRIAALRQLGIGKVRVLIQDLDDDQIIKEMTAENATQSGYIFPAVVDSVTAIVRRVAYLLLVNDTWEDLASRARGSNLFPNSRSFIEAKKHLRNGSGLGEDIIHRYCNGSLSEHSIRDAISAMKKSDIMATLVARVQQQIADEQQAAAEVEAEQRAYAEQLKREHEAALKAAEEAAKAAAEQAKKTEAARKAAAEARAAEEKKKAEKLKEMRDKANAEEAERQRKYEEQRAAREKAEAEAAAARAEFEKNSRGLNPRVLSMFRSTRDQIEFQKAVTTEEGRRIFPTVEQPETVERMYRDLDAAYPGGTNSEMVRAWMQGEFAKYHAETRRRQEEAQKRREREAVETKAEGIVVRFREAMGKVMSSLHELHHAGENSELAQWIIIKADDTTIIKYIDQIEEMVPKVRTALKLKTFRDPKRVEKVIPEYTEMKAVK